MNNAHVPGGVKEGGQFASTTGLNSYTIRNAKDMNSHFGITMGLLSDLNSERDESRKEELRKKLSSEAACALYDGGYIKDKNGSVDYRETVDVLSNITSESYVTEPFKRHREYIDNYLDVIRSFGDNVDVIRNGIRSDDKTFRDAERTMREFRLTNDDIKKLVRSMTADDFVYASRNMSRIYEDQGTVVMLFSPRITLKKESITPNGVKTTKHIVDLYVKLVINPHIGSRNENNVQIISFKEPEKPLTLLYSGKRRMSREDWKHNKRDPDNPKTRKHG